MDHAKELKRILSELRSEKESVRNELRYYPNGKLMLSNNHGIIQKIMVTKEKGSKLNRKGIGRDRELVHKLARKEYLKAELEHLRFNIRLLEQTSKQFKGTGINNILPDLPKYYDSLPQDMLQTSALKRSRFNAPHPDESVPLQPAKKFIDSISTESWGRGPYKPNTTFPEKKTIQLPNGLKVRSKSEAAIIGLYEKYGIPFHYDEVLSFADLYYSANNGAESKENALTLDPSLKLILSPDFIAARKDGKLIYHEHFGMINDPGYLTHMQQKLQIYAACGIVPWDNLIITFDAPDWGIDLKSVEAKMRAIGLI